MRKINFTIMFSTLKVQSWPADCNSDGIQLLNIKYMKYDEIIQGKACVELLNFAPRGVLCISNKCTTTDSMRMTVTRSISQYDRQKN